MDAGEIGKRLAQAQIANATFEARLLCESFSGDALEQAVTRRIQGYPLQYILGEWDFYRETYEVNPHCLIPRADTELLVEQAVLRLPRNAVFLDLCTGSGCVAISTLCARSDTTAVAVDWFEETLSLAKRNAERNGVAARIAWERANVLSAPAEAFAVGSFDAILSNPPYIKDSVVPTLQREVGFEPSAALCGGEDGLDFYRSILKQWKCLLKPGGFILFEIGYDQAVDVVELGQKNGFSAKVFRDYGGNDRVVFLK